MNDHNKHHLVPFWVYYLIWISLMVLTVITVAASYIEFGLANITIALTIATIKALLVILFFMGLRYDDKENNVTFFVSFVFLAIFISLTASDEFFRKPTEAARVEKGAAIQTATSGADISKFTKSTQELVEKGKLLYAQNCVTCHGAQGKGDGPAAASLNPKPRNFTAAEGWKTGRTVTKVYKVISDGLAGTPMPPFSSLSEEERFALTHFVRSLMASSPTDSPEELASLQKPAGQLKPQIPISVALERMIEPSSGIRKKH